jgi:hypothetical protein
MNAYEEKKAARIERLHVRAELLTERAGEVEARASKMAEAIPFGQPILVGHYSEGRDRRYREKIRKGFDKAAALSREAADAARRANAAEHNDAVSSDDPDAPDKLRAKLVKLESDHRRMVTFNKALRAGKTDAELAAATGLSLGAVSELRQPDFAGRVGFADYMLTNSSANIRRIRARVEALEVQSAAPVPEPETIGAVRIEETENRVRMSFPGKPAEEFRSRLKSYGFRWSPTAGAWQRMASVQAWVLARELAAGYGG